MNAQVIKIHCALKSRIVDHQIQIEIYLTFTERANGNKFAHKKAGLHGSKDLQVLILFLC